MNSIVADIPFAKLSYGPYWQMKIFLLIIIFIYAFFKFTWSMRQYNYVSIYIASMPDYRKLPANAEELAVRGAFLTSNAAKHFNNGLRAYYFGLAALAWFVHPYAFMAASAGSCGSRTAANIVRQHSSACATNGQKILG